jgi:transposase
MGAPYSQDLRDRILAAYDRGMKTGQIAKLFDVCSAWARRVKQRRRESGQVRAKPMGGIRVVKIDLDKLRELVAQQPDATIKQLQQRLGVSCSPSAVAMALGRLKLTFKKRRSMLPNKTGQTSPRIAPTGRPASTSSRSDG